MFFIPTGSSRLLEIGFRTIGKIHMDHKAYIRLINAHSKGIGGHHDPELVPGPLLLYFSPKARL